LAWLEETQEPFLIDDNLEIDWKKTMKKRALAAASAGIYYTSLYYLLFFGMYAV
jgi:hypothetical protein